MGILKIECDHCGKETTDFQEDYDGQVLCLPCHNQHEIKGLEAQYKNKMEWLKNTHLKNLKDLKQQIKKLKTRS